ncbi:MAG TPA: PTS sugar transporter subunit IIA [Enterobacteriaceae bacterium]|nr:PTS sugar transporter subunit IIA [Enterobacteriaceae bacterium]
MMSEIIPGQNIQLKTAAADWRQAIRAAGDLLVAGGYTTPDYTREMIEAVETLGPYIVVAPGLALAHSRPAASVIKTGLSLVTLATPVNFGSQENDPVHIVFGLCATDNHNHIEMLSQLVQFLDDPQNIALLESATDVNTLYLAINHLK